MNLLTKQKETHKLRELTYVCWVVGVQRRKGSEGVWDGHVNTAIKWITNEDMELCSMLCVWMGVNLVRRMDTCIYIWLNSFTVHLQLSYHCLLITYIPIQNKKL